MLRTLSSPDRAQLPRRLADLVDVNARLPSELVLAVQNKRRTRRRFC